MLMISTEVNYSFNFAFSLNNTFLPKLNSAIIFLIAVLKFLPKVTPDGSDASKIHLRRYLAKVAIKEQQCRLYLFLDWI